MRRKGPKAGFTLLELLIAVAVLAIVLAIIYESYWISIRNLAAAQEQSDLYQSARIGLRRLSEDLMCAYVPLGEEPSGEAATGGAVGSGEGAFRAVDIGSESADQDTLEFVSTANLARGAAAYMDWCEIQYSIEDGSLVRTSTAGTDDSESVELAPNVKGLDFRFFSADGEEYEDWDSSQTSRLPAIVEITLAMGGEEDEPLFFTTAVHIPLAWEREALGRGLAKLEAEEESRAKSKAAATAEEEGEEEGSGPGGGRLSQPGQSSRSSAGFEEDEEDYEEDDDDW